MALFPDSLYDFPNVSAYDSDLREVLPMLRGITHEMKDFKAVNTITNAGAWDITKQYKPWTIVSDNNIGYISVRPVPAGIEITNTDYWALVADYDILITNLSERISALENSVAKLNRAVGGKWLFITDSYGTTAGNESGDSTTIESELSQLMDTSDISFYAISGSGFVGDGIAPTFLQYLQNTITPTVSDKESITRIYICAGRNDISAEEVTAAAIATFSAYVKANYPNAAIYIGYIANGNNTAEGTKVQQIAGYNAYMRAPEYGCKYLTAIENILHDNALMYLDGVHPNANGKKAIARAIFQTILNLPTTINKPYTTQNVTPISGLIIESGSLNIAEYVVNNFLYPNITAGVTLPSPVSVGAYQTTAIKLGDVAHDSGYILAPYGDVSFTLALSVIEYGGGASHAETANASINADGELIIRFRSTSTYNASAIFIDTLRYNVTPLVYC